MDVLIALAAKALAPEKVALREESQHALELLTKATAAFTEKTAATLREWQNKDAAMIEAALTSGDGS